MSEHFKSKTHLMVLKMLEQKNKNELPRIFDSNNAKTSTTTNKIFNIVYSLIKRNRPLSDMEAEVELQIKNGIDLGISLHSRFSAIRITEHISKQMRKIIVQKLIESNSKICVIINEASTVSSKSLLVMFLKFEMERENPILFLDLVHLESQTAEHIFNTLMQTLISNGFSMDFLKENLIGFCSDGASTMLGQKSGVATRLTKEFPYIIVWHCLNHRLQLILDDAIGEIKQVNHFKSFIDKIYVIFHQSNKNQLRLKTISRDLEIEIIKIGRVLGPRWAACSLRSALAVWRAYVPLYKFFKEDSKYLGMANRLANKYFIKDLALMIDIIQEISYLSIALQERSVTLQKATKLIKRTINVMIHFKENLGPLEKKIEEMLASPAFADIPFVENQKFESLPRKKLIETIIDKMTSRILNCGHIRMNKNEKNNDIAELFNLLEANDWNLEELTCPWLFGEEQLKKLNEILRYEIPVNDFRDFVQSVIEGKKLEIESIQKAKNKINTICISSAEAERGFSLMNVICDTKRANLTIEHISNLMTVSMLGPPLEFWNPEPYVKTWLRNHIPADDTRIRTAAKKKLVKIMN